MDLKSLQREWKADSKIDPLKLGDHTLNIPQLHSKYLTYLSDEKVTLRGLNSERKKLSKKLEDYFHGRVDGKDIGREPYQHIVGTRTQLEKLVEADPEMLVLDSKISESEDLILFIKETISAINNMSYTIHNYVEWNKWLKGDTL